MNFIEDAFNWKKYILLQNQYEEDECGNPKEDPQHLIKEGDEISKGFTLILLFGLMLFGTTTIINLLVGVVISDVNKLQKDVLKRVYGFDHMSWILTFTPRA